MTREIKLALILGSALVLVVGVLISDHLSGARNARIAHVDPDFASPPVAANVVSSVPEPRRTGYALNFGPASATAAEPLPVTPSGALVDPSAEPVTSDPVAHLLPPTNETISPATPSEQDAILMEMAREQGIPFTYQPEPARVDPTPARTDAAKPVTQSAPANEIVVREGDTLWSLAEAHLGSGAQFTRLLDANKDRVGADGDIRVGTRLRLPASALAKTAGDSKPANANTKPADASRNNKPESKPANTKTADASKPKIEAKPASRTYTVKKGDTLGSIAAANLGTSKRWKDILDINPGLKPTDLRVGQSIKLPAK